MLFSQMLISQSVVRDVHLKLMPLASSILSPSELALKLKIFETHLNQIESDWRLAQLGRAVDILFPSYREGPNGENKPVCWPSEKTRGWINGASIKNLTQKSSEFHIELQSHLGGGAYAQFNLAVPYAWLDRDDMGEFLTKMCEDLKIQRDAEKKSDELLRENQSLRLAVERAKNSETEAIAFLEQKRQVVTKAGESLHAHQLLLAAFLLPAIAGANING